MIHFINFPTYLIIRLLQLPLFWRSILSYKNHTFMVHDYFLAGFISGSIFFNWHLLWIGLLLYCILVFYTIYKENILDEVLKDQEY